MRIPMTPVTFDGIRVCVASRSAAQASCPLPPYAGVDVEAGAHEVGARVCE